MFLISASSLQLIWSRTDLTSCLHPVYIIVRHPPSSCGRHKSHSIQPVHGQGYILIFLNRMHLLFTQVHFLFWQLGWGQYVTSPVVFCCIYPVCSCLLFFFPVFSKRTPEGYSFFLQPSGLVCWCSLASLRSSPKKGIDFSVRLHIFTSDPEMTL